MNKEESKNKGSLWTKTSKSGNKFYNGSITIEGTEYWLTMFNNDKKGNPKAPDYRLIAEPKEQVFTDITLDPTQLSDEDVYTTFGKHEEETENSDDLPF